jgi:hypothetical protein
LGLPADAPVTVQHPLHSGAFNDLRIDVGHHAFRVEVKATDDVATLERAAGRRCPGPAVELLVVPYMGPKAREWARAHGLAWADLSGNAEIHAHSLHVFVQGHPNAYASAGRPATPFSPRFSRVSRVLLAHPDTWWKQRDVVGETGLPDGTISKVVHRLNDMGLLERNDAGAVRARSPSLLLAAWAQRYAFQDHDVRRYHAVGRSGNAILQALAAKLSETEITWAATGLSAAYAYTGFADFRLTTIFVDAFPAHPEALGLRPVDRGENVWLVGPRDAGVFYGRMQRGPWCVHPVQAYLDLAGHAERSTEAAASLKGSPWMTWRAG